MHGRGHDNTERQAMTPEELSDRLLDFAVRVGTVVEALPDSRLGRHIAGQLVRCGTAPAANYEEGCWAVDRHRKAEGGQKE
jgi:four helix bundle protein